MEALLLNMVKCFQVYEYRSNLKARLVAYQLQGKATIWWEETKIIHVLDEKTVSWEEFQEKFKYKYLSESYYDYIAKKFHELRLGQLTIDEIVTKFTKLLHYVPYIREEKAKVQGFLNYLPTIYKEGIEFDNPKTMDVIVCKAWLCYQQFKGRNDQVKNWQNKEKWKVEGSTKRSKLVYLKNFGKKHEQKFFNKSGENQTAHSQTCSKPMEENSKREWVVKVK